MQANVQRRRKGSSNSAKPVDELASKLETSFSMVSCLSTNTISGVGWYVDSGASKHMTFNLEDLQQVSEQEEACK
jgi:hypothetical protein